MAYAPIAGIIPQYDEQDGWWLKFYQPTTSTPIAMSIDEDGTTTFAKAELDVDGFITTDGETLFIPFLDQPYDAFLFPTEAEADANDTVNAKRIAQDINPFADNITTVIKKIKPVITPGQTLITLDDQPVSVNVIIDGDTQQQSASAYTYTAGNIVLSEPLVGDEVVEVQYGLLISDSGVFVDDVGTAPNVSSMVFTDIPAGKKILTDGYISPGDGGAATYIITDPQDFSGTINLGNILLDNGNIAELIHNGTVYIEQFGVVGNDTYSDNLQEAINFSGVVKVLSSVASATFDKIAFIEKDNVTVDLSKTLITYIGDYDVYAQFGIGTDRSIGFINSRGILGTTNQTVTSSIIDGTSTLTLSSVSGLAVDDYIQLNITYPRRFDEQVAKIILIDGLDIYIDYTFGWTVTSCTVTKIDTMRRNNHVKLNLFDDSPATAVPNKISGIGFEYSANCSASWNVENHNYPAMMVYYSQDIDLSDGTATRPKDITAGRGYNVQINNSQRVDCIRLVARACRHIWDLSGASFCAIRDSSSYEPVDNISQYTTHGVYEHDILVENCYHSGGQNAFGIAISGAAFGSQTRRFTIRGGRYNGLVKSSNSSQFLMEDVEFFGTQVAEHEFAGTEGTIIRNVRFQTVSQIRIEVPPDLTGTDAIPSIADNILFDNCDFNDNLMRTTNVLGSIEFKRCKNFGLLSDSDLVDYPHNYKFEYCQLNIVTGWEVKPLNNLEIIDCDIDLDASISFSAGNSARISGGTLTSSNSNVRLKLDSQSVIGSDIQTQNSVGIFAEASCKAFSLSNITSVNPDASHTSFQFSTEGTTDCAFTINGMNVQYTGSGDSILFVNTGLQAIMTGSYVEGDISFAGATATAFAGNITPDTVLP